jgi:hypothetical protein
MKTVTITIPARVEHDGCHAVALTVPWACIHCGAPRGEPFLTESWDGSRRLPVHGWRNPCGHPELYSDVRAHYAANFAGAAA